MVALLDMRIGLSESQAYFADWSKKEDRKRILSTMQFTDKEAREHTPVSACGNNTFCITYCTSYRILWYYECHQLPKN